MHGTPAAGTLATQLQGGHWRPRGAGKDVGRCLYPAAEVRWVGSATQSLLPRAPRGSRLPPSRPPSLPMQPHPFPEQQCSLEASHAVHRDVAQVMRIGTHRRAALQWDEIFWPE